MAMADMPGPPTPTTWSRRGDERSKGAAGGVPDGVSGDVLTVLPRLEGRRRSSRAWCVRPRPRRPSATGDPFDQGGQAARAVLHAEAGSVVGELAAARVVAAQLVDRRAEPDAVA